jgi:hypothetical protein
MTMRVMILAAAAACLMATPARAQYMPDLSGTWAFQTNSYGNEEFGVIMSGAANFTATTAGRYTVQLIANELIVQRESSASQMLTARQNCVAEDADGQLTITCQLSEAVEGYEPDNFLLQAGTSPDELVGALTSGSSPQVTFTRLR